MSEPSCSTLRLIERFHLVPFHLFMLSHNHLGNTLTIIDDEGLIREIDKDDTDFSTIVSVNSSRRIQHSDPFLNGQSAARSHLRLKSLRQRDEKSGRYQTTL